MGHPGSTRERGGKTVTLARPAGGESPAGRRAAARLLLRKAFTPGRVICGILTGTWVLMALIGYSLPRGDLRILIITLAFGITATICTTVWLNGRLTRRSQERQTDQICRELEARASAAASAAVSALASETLAALAEFARPAAPGQTAPARLRAVDR